MRGIPLLEILLIAALFGFAAVPLAHLTRPREDVSPPPAETPPGATVPTYASARFAHPPTSASLGGTSLPAPDYDAEIDHSPGQPLTLSATWAAGTPPTAVTLTLEPEGLPAREHTFWSGEDSTLEAPVPQ